MIKKKKYIYIFSSSNVSVFAHAISLDLRLNLGFTYGNYRGLKKEPLEWLNSLRKLYIFFNMFGLNLMVTNLTLNTIYDNDLRFFFYSRVFFSREIFSNFV